MPLDVRLTGSDGKQGEAQTLSEKPQTVKVTVQKVDGEVESEQTVGDEEDAECIAAALAWENREDFLHYKLKKVGKTAALGVVGAVVPPLEGIGAGLRLGTTMAVMGALEGLKNTLATQAREDVEYILLKKKHKAVKAAIEMIPIPIVNKAPLAYNVAGALTKRNRGVHRSAVAERIFDRMDIDEQYQSIVFALFTNKLDPGLYVQLLLTTSDKALGVNVLKGKIAST